MDRLLTEKPKKSDFDKHAVTNYSVTREIENLIKGLIGIGNKRLKRKIRFEKMAE
jgi:hypothetical protein